MKKLSLITLLLVGGVSSAYAEGEMDGQMYGGLKYAKISSDLTVTFDGFGSAKGSASPTSILLFGGKTLSPNTAIEVSFMLSSSSDAVGGDYAGSDLKIEMDSYFDISFVGYTPASPELDLRGRVGFAQVKGKNNGGDTLDGSGITLAGSLAYKVSPTLKALLEYQIYPDIEDNFTGGNATAESTSINIGIMSAF